ncbi:MAG TPA: IPT/TIG domain-containing protein [Candidatus Paceibacterota bacterium]
MTKMLIGGATGLVLFVASVAGAQTYNYNNAYPYANTYAYPYVNTPTYTPVTDSSSYIGSNCIVLSRDLWYGSRGTDVTILQRFLVAQNYVGGGSWMITGYFGPATQAAVRMYQSMHNLPATGYVDASTRASMANCYGDYPYPHQGRVKLTSLTPTIATPGSIVTIYGSGFDYSNNTVYIGNNPVTSIASYTGTTLSFTVPSYLSGTQSVYVTNWRGTSNGLSLTISGSIPCLYPYQSGINCPCNYGSNYGYNCPITQPHIDRISPTSGTVGQTVTVYGSGFSYSGNTVRFGNGTIANVASYDGATLSFTVPQYLTGYGMQYVTPGTYNVSVTNQSGVTSNAVSFAVSSGGSYTGVPQISSVSGPTSLGLGAQGTWSVTVNAPQGTYTTLSVRWGDETYYGYAAAMPQSQYITGTQTFTFSHAYFRAGQQTITFTASSQNGQSNTATATVNIGSGYSGFTSLQSVSPTAGRVGTQVVLYGSGFTQNDNTVRFGSGGSRNVSSFSNGTAIYYTIPAWVTPCDPDQLCTMQAVPVTPGTYQISVSNVNGRTNSLSFTVLP